MTRIAIPLAMLLAGSGVTAATATEPPVPDIRPATGVVAEDFLWRSRLIVVFADSQDDPRFVTQMELLHDRPARLAERDVVVITDTDPAARSDIRVAFRPRGFMLVLIGKDGAILLRKPFPWDTREITRSIDKTPFRQRELDSAGR